MAVVTEKIFFKGTPAQFCAVIAEYELDTRAAAVDFSYQITEPSTEVIAPQAARYSGPGDDFGRLIDRVTSGFANRERVVDLRTGSPRAAIICYIGREHFWVSALLCPDNRTQLTLRVESGKLESIRNDWLSMVGYIANLGWLEDSQPVKRAQLSEPMDWVAELEEMGIGRDSAEWWTEIERRTRAYWAQKGRNALPVSGKSAVTLERVTGYSRKTIYEKTLLGEKEVTQSDRE
jgi:hypothetical protein